MTRITTVAKICNSPTAVSEKIELFASRSKDRRHASIWIYTSARRCRINQRLRLLGAEVARASAMFAAHWFQ